MKTCFPDSLACATAPGAPDGGAPTSAPAPAAKSGGGSVRRQGRQRSTACNFGYNGDTPLAGERRRYPADVQ